MAIRHKFLFELDEEVFVNGARRIILGRCFHPDNDATEKEQYLFIAAKGDQNTFSGDPKYSNMTEWVADIVDNGGIGGFSRSVGLFDRVKWVELEKLERISPLEHACIKIRKEIGL